MQNCHCEADLSRKFSFSNILPKFSGDIVFDPLMFWILKDGCGIVVLDELPSSKEDSSFIRNPRSLLHVVGDDHDRRYFPTGVRAGAKALVS